MHEQLSDFDLEWCQNLINSPDFVQLELPNRRPPPPFDKVVTNTLFAETLATDKTIRAWVVLKGRDKRPGSVSPEYVVLFSLGSGLDGHKGVAHGGFSALIMDQVMGMCATMTFGPISVTAETWQKFRRGIKVPSLVVCRAVCTQKDKNRILLESTIEDERGRVYCEGASTCVLREKKPARAKM